MNFNFLSLSVFSLVTLQACKERIRNSELNDLSLDDSNSSASHVANL